MAIKGVEYLSDRVRVHHHFGQPDGIPDDGKLDITYESIPKLPQLPEGKEGTELFVAECNATIVLVEKSWQETSFQCMYAYEPFLKRISTENARQS